MKSFFLCLRVVACMAAVFLHPTSCSTLSPGVRAGLSAAGKQALLEGESVIGKDLTTALFQTAAGELTGAKTDFGHSLVSGLYANIDVMQTASAFGRIASAYSAGKTPLTAAKVQSTAQQALAGGMDPSLVAHALAGVVSTAAGAPPGV